VVSDETVLGAVSHQVATLVRAGPVTDCVAEAPESVDARGVDLIQHRVERVIVSVDVRYDRDPHQQSRDLSRRGTRVGTRRLRAVADEGAGRPRLRLDPQTCSALVPYGRVRYERFLDYEWLLGTVVALVVMVRRGPRLARSLGSAENAGLITVWSSRRFCGQCRCRRFRGGCGSAGISTEDWGTIIFTRGEGLGILFGTVIVLAIFLLLAKQARNWWIGAAACSCLPSSCSSCSLRERYGTHRSERQPRR
jgi:hypothetical protein